MTPCSFETSSTSASLPTSDHIVRDAETAVSPSAYSPATVAVATTTFAALSTSTHGEPPPPPDPAAEPPRANALAARPNSLAAPPHSLSARPNSHSAAPQQPVSPAPTACPPAPNRAAARPNWVAAPELDAVVDAARRARRRGAGAALGARRRVTTAARRSERGTHGEADADRGLDAAHHGPFYALSRLQPQGRRRKNPAHDAGATRARPLRVRVDSGGRGEAERAAGKPFVLAGTKRVYERARPFTVRHIAIDLDVDFEHKSIRGEATLDVVRVDKTARELALDAVGFTIEKVELASVGDKRAEVAYAYDGECLEGLGSPRA